MSKEARTPAELPIIDPASYRLVGEFARGGYGRLLRAHDLRLNREVALKELFRHTQEAEERFIREALVTARLQHPSIVPIHEVGRWPTGELFYAMKLVSGRGLDQLIAEAQTLPQRLALVPHVLAVAEAVAYAHSERIIHRDLKPANVLVGAFGETMLIDWGLAKDLSDEAPLSDAEMNKAAEGVGYKLTGDGAVLGTPAYMSPEQAMSRPVDPRTDVYALGSILFHVLSGAQPFEGDTIFAVLAKKLGAAAPPDLAQQHPGVPPELATIAKKAMARAPADRYPTAQELVRDLRAFQTGQIVRAHKYSWSARARRFARRYRSVLAVATAALVMLAAAAVIFVQRIRAERDKARREQALAEIARREADERADELLLLQARSALDVDPNAAIRWLKKLSPAFSRWGAVRMIAGDARSRGLARLLTAHAAGINDVDISPDGKTVAFAGDDQRVSLWDLQDGSARVLSGHTNEVWAVNFSPDGRRLASGGRDETVRVWDVSTGEARVLTPALGPIWQVGFLPDGAHLATVSIHGSGHGVILIWDLSTGARREIESDANAVSLPLLPGATFIAWTARGELVLWDIERGEARRFPGQGAASKFVSSSPDGATVGSVEWGGKARIWAVKDGAVRALAEVSPGVHGLAFSPDSKQMGLAAEGGVLRLWDVATGQARDLHGHEGTVRSLRFSPRGDLLASGSDDRTVRLWDLGSGESRVRRGFAELPSTLAFSRDGRVLAAGSWDHTARAWDMDEIDGDVLARHEGGASAFAFFRDGRCVASAGKDGWIRTAPIRRRGAAPAECGRPFDKAAHDGPIHDLAALPSGGKVVTAGEDGTVRVDDVDGGEPIILKGHDGSVEVVAVSADGKWIASGGKDGTVRLWDLERREGRVVERHEAGVFELAFSPSSAFLASTGRDNAVRIWDVAASSSREILHIDRRLRGLVFSPDSGTLAFGDSWHNLYLWSVAAGQLRELLEPNAARRLAFLPSGDALVTAALEDIKIRVVSATTNAERTVLRGHSAEALDVACSPDGRRIATAHKDGSARLWDLETGDSRVLPGHKKEVVRVAFSPDGRFVVTAGADGTVRVFWDDLPVEPGALRAWIEGAAPGP